MRSGWRKFRIAVIGGFMGFLLAIGPAIGMGTPNYAQAFECNLTNVFSWCNQDFSNRKHPNGYGIVTPANVVKVDTPSGIRTAMPLRLFGGVPGLVANLVVGAGVAAYGLWQQFGLPGSSTVIEGDPVLTERGLVDQFYTPQNQWYSAQLDGTYAVVRPEMLNSQGVWNPVYSNAYGTFAVSIAVQGREITETVTILDGDWAGSNQRRLICKNLSTGEFWWTGDLGGPNPGVVEGEPGIRRVSRSCPVDFVPYLYGAVTTVYAAEPAFSARYIEDVGSPYTPYYSFGPGGVWFGASHPVRSQGAGREVLTRSVECKDASGAVTTMSDSISVTSSLPFELPDLLCPWDAKAQDVSIGWSTSHSQAQTIVPPGSVTMPTIPSEFVRPDCEDGSCQVQLHRMSEPCGFEAGDCVDWVSEWQLNPQLYTCTFGGQPVDIGMCSMYRAPLVGILPNFDPATNTFLSPSAPVPGVYPVTGVIANPSPGTGGQPGAPPGWNEPFPIPGGGISPAQECFENGWVEAANPVEWVLVPIKCALVWAFVPRPEIVEEMLAQVEEAWADTVVGRLPPLVADMFDVPEVSGCLGPHVYMPLQLGDLQVTVDMHPLSTCDEPMHSVAFYAKMLGAVMLIFLTVLGVIRRVSAIVSAPGLGTAGGAEG